MLNKAIKRFTVIAALLLSACGTEDPPPYDCNCRLEESTPISDGTFEPDPRAPDQISTFPHNASDVTDMKLIFRRDKKTVQFRYFKGAAAVVETWEIKTE